MRLPSGRRAASTITLPPKPAIFVFIAAGKLLSDVATDATTRTRQPVVTRRRNFVLIEALIAESLLMLHDPATGSGQRDAASSGVFLPAFASQRDVDIVPVYDGP